MKVMLRWPDEFHNEHVSDGGNTVFTSLEALECLGHYTAGEHWRDAFPTKTERRLPGSRCIESGVPEGKGGCGQLPKCNTSIRRFLDDPGVIQVQVYGEMQNILDK